MEHDEINDFCPIKEFEFGCFMNLMYMRSIEYRDSGKKPHCTDELMKMFIIKYLISSNMYHLD